jgi:type IV pilus assembly protein PilM
MKDSLLSRLVRIELAPPHYLSMPAGGIDISTSGVKLAVLEEKLGGIYLTHFGEKLLPLGAVTGGEISDPSLVGGAITELVHKNHVQFVHVALSESRSYLFEAVLEEDHTSVLDDELHTITEQHLDEYIPLPPNEVVFGVIPVSKTAERTIVSGVGYARRVIDESLSVLDGIGVTTKAVESETFSMARALMPCASKETVLIIDIGKTTTKLIVVTGQIPRFGTTLDIGGDALTQAVMKHFNVSEDEAKKIKAEKGLVSGGDQEEYIATMLSTVSAIREEITGRLEYWQNTAGKDDSHEPVTRAILIGGNATVRGLAEYFETAFKIPVGLGDVFTNLASRDTWIPPLDYMESLAYATAIGLALRDYSHV